VPAKSQPLFGRQGECGAVLTSANLGILDASGKVWGSHFPYGQTGMISLGNGEFYFSHPDSIKEQKIYSSTVVKYRFDSTDPDLFKEL